MKPVEGAAAAPDSTPYMPICDRLLPAQSSFWSVALRPIQCTERQCAERRVASSAPVVEVGIGVVICAAPAAYKSR
jgi:hypothetical protein